MKDYGEDKAKKIDLALELKDIIEKKLVEAIKRKCILVGDITKLKK